MTGLEVNSDFLFSEYLNVVLRRRQSELLYSKTKKKQNFEKLAEIPAITSGRLQLNALIACNSGQHFAGNSELFPVLVFAMAFDAEQI